MKLLRQISIGKFQKPTTKSHITGPKKSQKTMQTLYPLLNASNNNRQLKTPADAVKIKMHMPCTSSEINISEKITTMSCK